MKTERINEVLDCGFRYAKYKLCLKRNRVKDDSDTVGYEELLEGLKDEVKELVEAINTLVPLLAIGSCPARNYSLEKVALEAADVINYACMICDKTER